MRGSDHLLGRAATTDRGSAPSSASQQPPGAPPILDHGDSTQKPARESLRRLVVLVNPDAGGGSGDATPGIEELTRGVMRVDTIRIERDGAHVDELRDAAAHADAIVIAGGDGTFSRCLGDVVDLEKPIGLLPTGTANDLARTLGLPTDPRAAALVILDGRLRRIDLGRANGLYFCNAVGIGASVGVSRELGREEKSLFGAIAYGRAVWRVLKRANGFRIHLVGEGDVAYNGRSSQVTIANGVHYGGGMTVHETAAIDDGRLDVLVLRPESPGQYLRHFFAFRRGRYSDAAPVWSGRTSFVRVVTSRPRDCALDGEIRTRTPLEVAVVRKALEIFVPDGETTGS